MLKRSLIHILLLLTTLPVCAVDSLSVEISHRLDVLLADSLLRHSQMGMYVYDISDDTLLYAHTELQLMRPASCQKVVTAVTALSALGADYKFRTGIYLDGSRQGSTFKGNIIVRAGFDPLLTSAEVSQMIGVLRQKGIKTISGNLLLDLTIKDTLSRGSGWCWDDDDKLIRPLYLDGNPKFAAPFRNLLRKAGIQFQGRTLQRAVPKGAECVAEFQRPISAVMLPMMKESDNLCAEAVFYQLAAHSQKPRASAKDAVKYINALIDTLGLDARHYRIADGSGLSLYNYATPELFGHLLRYAYRTPQILPAFYESLPIYGEDGTLKKRRLSQHAIGNVHAKTGSVTGVSTLAGYCTTAHGHTLCFVIFNQGLIRAAHGRVFQDKVLEALTAGLTTTEALEGASFPNE
jgi:D-alanyl-D-alanine carboxypeptidase/D-alanyl-D-alanine-endopeptidase (penicillin-binding protein 4)